MLKSVTIENSEFLVDEAGTYFEACRRCWGTGNYSFDGQTSRCYRCNGGKIEGHVGTEAEATKIATRRAKDKARRDAKRTAEFNARIEAMHAAQAQVPTDVREFVESLAEDINEGRERSSFLISMSDRFNNFRAMVEWGGFSEAQITAIRKVIVDRAAKAEAKAQVAPLTAGRQVIRGTVKSTKVQDSDYGTTYKMIVELASGHRVFGSVPAAIYEGRLLADLIGLEVEFTAAVEPSRDDNTFGFYSRPTKASVR